MAGSLRPLPICGVLRLRPGRLRVARSFRTDADAHSIQWHEHCFSAQPVGVDHAGWHLSTGCQQIRLLGDVLPFCRIYRDLLSDRDVLPARNKRENAGGNRTVLRDRSDSVNPSYPTISYGLAKYLFKASAL